MRAGEIYDKRRAEGNGDGGAQARARERTTREDAPAKVDAKEARADMCAVRYRACVVVRSG